MVLKDKYLRWPKMMVLNKKEQSLVCCITVHFTVSINVVNQYCLVFIVYYCSLLARATVGTSLYVSLLQSVSQLVRQSVSQCVSVFQNSYQGTSRSCRELKFCLEVVCTSQHSSNHQRSLAELCHTQNFYLRKKLIKKTVPGPSLHNLSCA